jgi:hypothetical protein
MKTPLHCSASMAVMLFALVLGLTLSAQAQFQSCVNQDASCSTGCSQQCNGVNNPCYSNCTAGCTNQYNGCNATGVYYQTNYHNWELLSGQGNQEMMSCRKTGHRAAFNQCFKGNFYDAASFQTCRNAGGDVVSCCGAQENEYDNDNCLF